MLIVLALLAAAVVGGLALLVIGPVVAVAVSVLLLIAGVAAHRAEGGVRRALGLTLLVALLAAGSYASLLTFELVEAVSATDVAADPADAEDLNSAEAKLDDLSGSEFRIELTEPELQAVIQDGLVASGDAPIRRIDVDFRRATADLGFIATFKVGNIRATGSADVEVVDGGIDLVLGPLQFGSIRVPGIASESVQSLLGAVTDLNTALADQEATVQTVEITDDLLIVTGTRSTSDVLTNTDLLAAIREQAVVALDAVQAPAERIGRGALAGLDEPGSPTIIALGDSLAANVGVQDARDGFVSRFHNAVSQADGIDYGLVNLAVPGETSGSMLSGGQLQAAEARLATTAAAYIIVDIGSNDLLGHLQSDACGTNLSNTACQQLVADSLVGYETNVGSILDRTLAAADGAQLIFLTTYNPFSLGLGDSAQERQSSEIISRLNAVAIEAAEARNVTVADGFTPMQSTTAATTHMLDATPDIHPNAAGHDVLAGALVDAR